MSEGSLKRLINKISSSVGIKISRKKFDKHTDGLITLQPEGAAKGNVLLAYIIDPFLLKSDEKIPKSHTHFLESTLIAQTFREMGYSVDVISYLNNVFRPVKDYSFFISARTNFQQIAQHLNKECIKIAHLDVAHWITNNHLAYQRCFNVHKRRNSVIQNYKLIKENFAIEYADYATILGNDFTINTYRYANKPLFRIHLPTCLTFPMFEDKNYKTSKNNFLWFGSSGLIHKGLDLVLEAFAQMPDFNLLVCGPIDQEKDFQEVYFKELYQTANIKTIGWIDIESKEFESILKRCIAVVFPSCAEGGGGSVITCMQGGLIPIVSYEASVDVHDEYGVILKSSTVEEIKNAVRYMAGLSDDTLNQMAKNSRSFAVTNHTMDTYKKRYTEVIETIIELEEKKKNTKTVY